MCRRVIALKQRPVELDCEDNSKHILCGSCRYPTDLSDRAKLFMLSTMLSIGKARAMLLATIEFHPATLGPALEAETGAPGTLRSLDSLPVTIATVATVITLPPQVCFSFSLR